MELVLVVLLGLFTCLPGVAGRVWYDGSTDAENSPPGKLLTDNEGWWGPAVLTGVDYSYQVEPDNPGDWLKDDKAQFGRRLLDGLPVGNWWTSAGISNQPLVVVFDFTRPCQFIEVDVSARSHPLALKIETRRSPEEEWQLAIARSLTESPDSELQRLILPSPGAGRYLRLTAQAEGITWLDEVWVWGDAVVSEEYPEVIRPVGERPAPGQGVALCSVPGISKTAFSDAQAWAWRTTLGKEITSQGLWSLLPSWEALSAKPILPGPSELASKVSLKMTRNETEGLAVALTNPSLTETRSYELGFGTLRPEAALSCQWRAFGAIPSRWYGISLGPLFAPGDVMAPGLMKRYLTNAAQLLELPTVTLGPCESVVLWLSFTSWQATPGQYEVRFGGTGLKPLTVGLDVLHVTLPSPRLWLQTWSGTTGMFPFVYSDRQQREVGYKVRLGASVWGHWPEPGTDAALARAHGKPFFHIWGLGDWGHKGYNSQLAPEDITPEVEAEIAALLQQHVVKALELGLDFDDWYIELWDEPGRSNARLCGAFAALVRKLDPRIRIYCNPSFWVGGEDLIVPAPEVEQLLGDWYKEAVDVSCPFTMLLDKSETSRLFSTPRLINAHYTVASQSAKSENRPEVELYRRLAWEAFAHEFNGWGFYSYYAPRGNPWNDFDSSTFGEDLPDYQVVYPGPSGPIPTRQSEAVREGYEDYCLLCLLRNQGHGKQVEALVERFRKGIAPEQLRLEAINLASKRSTNGK